MFNAKKWINSLGLLVVKVIAPLFFDRRYLRGKLFEDSQIGWVWIMRGIFYQKLLGFNREVPWPISPTFKISDFTMIDFDVDDIDNFQSGGCYFQNFSAKIYIGTGTKIAPNVGLITSNHNLRDLDCYEEALSIRIGRKCWIGMNAVILPGVLLGDNTVVGAGAVVTRSFPEGNCVLVGSPAWILKKIE
jgi:acetyltransferase-like isoleucine patch superfamily enzyme